MPVTELQYHDNVVSSTPGQQVDRLLLLSVQQRSHSLPFKGYAPMQLSRMHGLQVRYNGERGYWLQLSSSSGSTLGGDRSNCNAAACLGVYLWGGG
jgi:hypothetical protein